VDEATPSVRAFTKTAKAIGRATSNEKFDAAVTFEPPPGTRIRSSNDARILHRNLFIKAV
jgi:hypothetical protein